MNRTQKIASLNDALRRTQKIASLNDALRLGSGPGRVMLTQGILALSNVSQVLRGVHNATFGFDNDPYGEHDFGSMDLDDGTKAFWKIDYYDTRDPNMETGAEDPSDEKTTLRVLTVMLASEY